MAVHYTGRNNPRNDGWTTQNLRPFHCLSTPHLLHFMTHHVRENQSMNGMALILWVASPVILE